MLTYCNLTEGLLEPTAGDWSRQVSGHDLATLRPLLTFRGIAACRLVELGWMQWAVAKMLETPMLEEKMPEHFRDPQTGDIWLIAKYDQRMTSKLKQEVLPTPSPLSSQKLPVEKCLLKRFQCKAFRHTKGVMSFKTADDFCDTKKCCRPERYFLLTHHDNSPWHI